MHGLCYIEDNLIGRNIASQLELKNASILCCAITISYEKAKMGERRRWSQTETEFLIDMVQKNYTFLTGTFTPSKTKAMVDKKWSEIAHAINALGCGSAILSTEQIQKKWSDMKSTSKKAVSKYKIESKRTGGRMNKVKQPSEYQVRIADIIGKAYTECTPGTEECDTSVEIAAEINVDESEPCSSKSSETFTESAGDTSSDDRLCSTTTKRRRCEKGAPTSSSRPTKRQTQNQEILETEKDMVIAVNAMKEELKRTNSLIENIGEHMKQSNDIHQQILKLQQNCPADQDDLNTFVGLLNA